MRIYVRLLANGRGMATNGEARDATLSANERINGVRRRRMIMICDMYGVCMRVSLMDVCSANWTAHNSRRRLCRRNTTQCVPNCNVHTTICGVNERMIMHLCPRLHSPQQQPAVANSPDTIFVPNITACACVCVQLGAGIHPGADANASMVAVVMVANDSIHNRWRTRARTVRTRDGREKDGNVN